MALLGFMGAGKTTIGRALAQRRGARFADLDQLVEDAAGAPPAQIFATGGEPEFRAIEAAVLARAAVDGWDVLSLGGGTPMDDRNWALIRSRWLTVHLAAPFELLWRRVRGDAGRPLVAAGEESASRLYSGRIARYREADVQVDASGPVDMVVEEVDRAWPR